MKILIIDDEMPVLTKMKVLLSAYGECTLATTARQAIQLCTSALQENKPFDLITIDIHLKDVSGLDLLASINQIENETTLPPAKKVVVTAAGTKDNIIRAMIKGCDGFLVKPVKRDTLEQKLDSLGFVKPSPAVA
jgi:two-component system chemotaxis response regulator CheY